MTEPLNKSIRFEESTKFEVLIEKEATVSHRCRDLKLSIFL